MPEISVFTPSYEKFKLPSNGIAGGITMLDVRPMTLKEERLLTNKTVMAQGTVHDEIMEQVVGKAYNEKGEEVPVNLQAIFSEDEYALLLFIRAISYGFDYEVDLTCPHCKRSEHVTINLETDLPIKYAPKGTKPYVELELPVTKKNVKIMYPTKGVADGKMSVTEMIPELIMEAEGIDKNIIPMWVENSLIGRDIAALRKAIENPPFGVAKKVKHVCKNGACTKAGVVQELPLPITPEFFRI